MSKINNLKVGEEQTLQVYFYSMSIKPAEEYLRKLNQIPPQAKEILEQVGRLDRQVLTLHLDIKAKRDRVLERVIEYEEKKQGKSKAEVQQLLKSVNRVHKRLLKITRKKKQLVERLYNCVDAPTEQLERDLSQMMPIEQEKDHRHRKNKKDPAEQYLNSEPCYCYCKRPSYGLMVKCGSDKCETEWFHMDCVEEGVKSLPGDWQCNDCRQSRDKRRTRS